MDIMKQAMEDFSELHKDEAEFTFTFGEESEVSCKATILENPEAAADIFFYTDDQFEDLYRAGTLLELTEDTDQVLEAMGGPDSGVAAACTREDRLYSYPFSAGNGYFLYYRPSYFSETDIATMDRLLNAAEKAGKYITMELTNGWYLYSFFKGAGLGLHFDSEHDKNYCNWNTKAGKYTGADVVEALLRLVKREGYLSLSDDEFLKAAQNGTVIAAVSGPWNLENLEKIWPGDVATAKLPTYTLKGDQVQMCSFMGYKLAGVNNYTKEPHWAMQAAEFMTGKDIQLKRFKKIGECPANQEAASSPEVMSSPVVRALAEQAKYGYSQNVGELYWDAAELLGASIAAGNPDDMDIQILLDRMVDAAEGN